MPNPLREEILGRLNIAAEFDSLLGRGKGNARSCWNKAAHKHGDNSASLSFNAQHSGWKCHSCGEKGDIFSLYMKVKGVTFPQALEHYSKVTGLWERQLKDYKVPSQDPKDSKLLSGGKERPVWKEVDQQVKNKVINGRMGWTPEKREFMFKRYGITGETIRKYNLSLVQGRLAIPIFVDRVGSNNGQLPKMYNVRFHDTFRAHCDWLNSLTNEVVKHQPDEIGLTKIAEQSTFPWVPVWSDGNGKVKSVKGHGAIYLYPFHVMQESASLYLVGGELKALLLNQLGVPAVAFTAGEGQYSDQLIPYFLGKRVRVIMDPDETGVKGAENVAQTLCDNGAYVELGRWKPEVVELLPPKGDITDLLRLMDWTAQVLDDPQAIEWVELEPNLQSEIEEMKSLSGTAPDFIEPIPPLEEMELISFSSLVDPTLISKWVRVKAILTGKAETPFAVPRRVHVTCERGRVDPTNKCGACGLYANGCVRDIENSVDDLMEISGVAGRKLEAEYKQRLNIPKGCTYPRFEVDSCAMDYALISPSLDGNDIRDVTAADFSHRNVTFIQDEVMYLQENHTYEIGGKLLQDPKSGRFSLASTSSKLVGNDVFNWEFKPDLNGRLKRITMLGGYKAILDDVRDNVVKIYDQDGMITAIMLSFFMPFTFRLSTYVNERICPAVMIMGDTNTGKSTTSRNLIRHFGAGRYFSSDSDPTFAGLLGGYTQVNGRPVFNWGIIPASHRGFVSMDEFNKVPVETIDKLANTITSGISERVTAFGLKRAKSWVRLLYMANPRGVRRLTSYSDPFQAVREVMGAVQNVGRLEYVWVEHGAKRSLFQQMEYKEQQSVPHVYTEELAKYHLSWAWSLKPEHIEFDDPKRIMRDSFGLAEEFGDHPVFLHQQARFKLARIAAGFAAMTFSQGAEPWLCRVTNEHVNMAIAFLRAAYGKYLGQQKLVSLASDTGLLMPEKLVAFLDEVVKDKELDWLNGFLTADRWTFDDLRDIFEQQDASRRFIELAQIQLGLLSREKNYLKIKEPRFGEMMESYINYRRNFQEYKK